MALTNSYTVATGRIPDLFSKIRDGQAPDMLSHQLLKDWVFFLLMESQLQDTMTTGITRAQKK